MSRPTQPAHAARSGVDTPAAVRQRLEREAQGAARDLALSPPRDLAPSAGPAALGAAPAGRTEEAGAVPGVGRPLAPPGPGRSREIRLHDDEAAARQAEELGARAFAYGNHVVLGRDVRPGTPEGDRVLAHELAHTAQQARPGAGSQVQRDPEERQGIGSRAPQENYVTMPGEVGSEDEHVLFDRDSATLDERDAATLRSLIQQYPEAVTLHIHGYSSQEGAEEYNMNLSAHRAVAVKRFVEGLLPEGSQVVVYAHGEVTDFGTRAQNRRVGVDVIQRGPAARHLAEPPLFGPLFGSSFGFDLDLTLRPLPPLSDLLGGLPGGGLPTLGFDPVARPNYFLEVPSAVPPYDPGGPAAAYSFRGVPYTARDAHSFQQHYDFWAGQYVRWGLSPERAAWLAQLGTDTAASIQLSVEHPTRFELLDRSLGTEPTIIPVFNDTMMRWLFDQFRD